MNKMVKSFHLRILFFSFSFFQFRQFGNFLFRGKLGIPRYTRCHQAGWASSKKILTSLAIHMKYFCIWNINKVQKSCACDKSHWQNILRVCQRVREQSHASPDMACRCRENLLFLYTSFHDCCSPPLIISRVILVYLFFYSLRSSL